MLPAITPPTDNLYKFICLFGLTLFLFFSYSLSFVHDRLSKNHQLLENIRTTAQHELLRYKVIQGKKVNQQCRTTIKHASEIADLKRELLKMEALMEKSLPDHKQIIALSGELNKVEISMHGLKTKIWLYMAFLSVGVVMVYWGFRRWQLRDQNVRDTLLRLDEEIKQAERNQLNRS